MIEYSQVNLKKWNVFEPVPDEVLQSIELAHVFGAEGESAYFVTSDDEVFAIGQNVLGRLGIGSQLLLEAKTPTRLNNLCGKSIMCFTTSMIHTLALSKSGEVYSWGSNTFGQIGNGSLRTQDEPGRVIFPEDVCIQQIATADRYCLALTENNRLYHWGDLNWDHLYQQPVPLEINLPYESVIVNICCGAFHATALTDEGKVLAWGCNDSGQLGNEGTEIQLDPSIVRGQIEDQFIIKIACTVLTTVVLTQEGILYAWGSIGGDIPIGHPKEIIRYPQRVLFRKDIIDIASNNYSKFIFAEGKDPHKFYFWCFDGEDNLQPEVQNCSCILDAFAGQAMPVVMRKRAQEPRNTMVQNDLDIIQDNDQLLKPMQGPVRDIGKALFNKSEFSDLLILLTDGEVYVHSLILKTFSEHFKTLLAENWSNGKAVIEMKQYNPNAYRAFLKFVYTGVLEPLEGIEIIALCDIAVSYFENDLRDLCIEMFKCCLNSQNVVQLYSLAVGNHSELVDSCVQFTSQNLDAVILSSGFENLDPVLSKSLILNAVKVKYNKTKDISSFKIIRHKYI